MADRDLGGAGDLAGELPLASRPTEDANRTTSADQPPRHMAADEPRGTRDQVHRASRNQRTHRSMAGVTGPALNPSSVCARAPSKQRYLPIRPLMAEGSAGAFLVERSAVHSATPPTSS